MVNKFTVSNDPKIYEAWPCLARTPSDKLVCVFSECTHHGDRSYTRIVTCSSTDRRRTWSANQPGTVASPTIGWGDGQAVDPALAAVVGGDHCSD